MAVTQATLADRLRASIRDIPDFPKPGILFKDITPVLADPALFRDTIAALANQWRAEKPDVVVGIESRGFIFGAPLALALETAFIPIRKPGKLPYKTMRVEYALEYGTDALEAHQDAVAGGQRVLIVDDVLATGGTAAAAAKLVSQLGGDVIGAAFLIELGFLNGRERLDTLQTRALITY